MHYKNQKYLRALRKSPCIDCGREEEVQAHHVIKRGSGVTDDRTCIPLCSVCHSKAHNTLGLRQGHLAIAYQLALKASEYGVFDKDTLIKDFEIYKQRLILTTRPEYYKK